MHYRNSAGAASTRTESLKRFQSAEVDRENSESLWLEFEEMPLFNVTKQIPDEAVPQHMKDYLQCTGRKKVTGKRWLGRCQCKSCCCMLHICCYVGM